MSECHRVLKPSGNFFLNFQGQYCDGRFSLTEAKIPIVAVEELGFDYVQPFIGRNTTAEAGQLSAAPQETSTRSSTTSSKTLTIMRFTKMRCASRAAIKGMIRPVSCVFNAARPDG